MTGITCPIVPGIMPIHGYAGFMRMTQLCKTYVPPQIYEELEPIKVLFASRSHQDSSLL